MTALIFNYLVLYSMDVFEDNMVEAKAKANWPQNFVLEVSSRSRPVLEDPIPAL